MSTTTAAPGGKRRKTMETDADLQFAAGRMSTGSDAIEIIQPDSIPDVSLAEDYSPEVMPKKMFDLDDALDGQDDVVKENKSEVEDDAMLKVVCRIRPESNALEGRCFEKTNGTTVEGNAPHGSEEFKKNNVGARFQFTKVYDENDTTKSVYDDVLAPKAEKFIRDGESVLCFAYGITNAGKTYTIQGLDEDPGMLMMVLNQVFGLKSSVYAEQGASLQISFLEIYNESMRDLFVDGAKADKAPPLQLKGVKQRVHVKDLTWLEMDTVETGFQWYMSATQRRHARATKGHDYQSSRSHSVFSIRLCVPGRPDAQMIICDLAGAERLNNTLKEGATAKENAASLKETCKINQSLLTLGTCLEKLRWNSQHALAKPKPIPFRESKLTRLFEPHFTSTNAHTIMICCIRPSHHHYDATAQSLHYASLAQEIVSKRLDNGGGAAPAGTEHLEKMMNRMQAENQAKDELVLDLQNQCGALKESVEEQQADLTHMENTQLELINKMAVQEADIREECWNQQQEQLTALQTRHKNDMLSLRQTMNVDSDDDDDSEEDSEDEDEDEDEEEEEEEEEETPLLGAPNQAVSMIVMDACTAKVASPLKGSGVVSHSADMEVVSQYKAQMSQMEMAQQKEVDKIRRREADKRRALESEIDALKVKVTTLENCVADSHKSGEETSAALESTRHELAILRASSKGGRPPHNSKHGSQTARAPAAEAAGIKTTSHAVSKKNKLKPVLHSQLTGAEAAASHSVVLPAKSSVVGCPTTADLKKTDNKPRYDRIEMLNVAANAPRNNKGVKSSTNTLWKGTVSQSVSKEGISVQFTDVEVLSQTDVKGHLQSPLSPQSKNTANMAKGQQNTKQNPLKRRIADNGQGAENSKPVQVAMKRAPAIGAVTSKGIPLFTPVAKRTRGGKNL